MVGPDTDGPAIEPPGARRDHAGTAYLAGVCRRRPAYDRHGALAQAWRQSDALAFRRAPLPRLYLAPVLCAHPAVRGLRRHRARLVPGRAGPVGCDAHLWSGHAPLRPPHLPAPRHLGLRYDDDRDALSGDGIAEDEIGGSLP